MANPSPNSNWTSAQEIKKLKKEVAQLQKFVEAIRPIGSTFGLYKGNDGRRVPAVITGAFPKAGTVDIVVFDNLYSGGKTDLTGIKLGAEKNQIQTYVVPDLEDNDYEQKPEESEIEFVAS